MLPGDVVADRFVIERLAKSGGMGEVYRATDRNDGSAVAMKMLSGCSEQAETYFAREARILAELRHPAVVEYRAHGRTPTGTLWLAMEWLDGVDLEERMQKSPLNVREALALVRRAAEALGAAHERAIVHRDIKPSNLFLVEGNIEKAKLLDFGIARSREATRPATRTGMLLGTPGYMAPEQTLGSKDLTPAADVFALGCVLYECLTGEAAFSGEHMMVVLAKIILGQTPRIRIARPGVPTALDDLVASMLAKDPSERPRDGKQLAAAIRAVENALGDSEVNADANTEPGSEDGWPARADTVPAGQPVAQSTFVGRERELGVLTAVYGDCVWSPRARAVIVTAPSGYGKSRLVRELLTAVRAHEQPADIWVARGDAMSKGSPFGMLARLIRGAATIEGGESPEAQSRKLKERVARVVPPADVDRVSRFLGEVARIRFAPTASLPVVAAVQDARLMGAQIRRAFEEWLAAETAQQPIVIVLEDLDDGDKPSLEVIETARKNLADSPLLVVATGRPALQGLAPYFGERTVTQVELAPLEAEAAEHLVREALVNKSGHSVTLPLPVLLQRSRGNAFHLQELARVGPSAFPDTMIESAPAVARAVIDNLSDRARRVVGAASVLGNVFWEGAVASVLTGGTLTTELGGLLENRSAMTELLERDVLRTIGTRPFPKQNQLGFRHDLLREAAYETLESSERAQFHARAGQWLERSGEADAGTLAEHFRLAGDSARAAGYSARAAELALEGGDSDSVLLWADRAVALGASGDLLGTVRLLQAEAYRQRGDHPETLRYASDAMSHLPRGSALWYGAIGEIGQAAGQIGDHVRLERAYHDLLLAPIDGVTAPHAIAVARLALQLLQSGRHAVADLAFRDLSHVPSHVIASDPEVAASIHRARAVRAHYSGDPGAALVEFSAAAKAFRDVGDDLSAATQRGNVGFMHVELGEYAEAERALREALEVADRYRLAGLTAFAKHNLGLALGRQGRLDEGRRMEEQAAQAYRAEGNRRMEGGSRIYLANILASAGELTTAEEQAQEAIALSSAHPPVQAHALATLADIWLLLGRARDAFQPAEEALRLLEDLGGIEDGEALVRLVHAVALAQLGHHDQAKTSIAKARDRLLSRADKIASPIWRTSFLTRVPENARTLTLARQWKAVGRSG
ncbi:MAG: protein kinase [Polyangiaceae bacterium]|nr:protein kinase [Polyangiaceae bacterium]